MVPNAVLISSPSVDFGTLLGLSQQALGYNVAAAVDASAIERSDAERLLSCLAAMQRRDAKPGVAPHLLSHVSITVLVAADDEDMLEILSAVEMPFLVVDTIVRGVQLAVMTGTLTAWRDAVRRGTLRRQHANVRACFSCIQGLLTTAGLNVWSECESAPPTDTTLLLENRR